MDQRSGGPLQILGTCTVDSSLIKNCLYRIDNVAGGYWFGPSDLVYPIMSQVLEALVVSLGAS